MRDTTPSTPAATHRPGKPLSWIGLVPAPEVGSFDSLPWYRKDWILPPIFLPVAIFVVLTGDLYSKASKRSKRYSPADAWRYTAPAKAVLIAAQAVFFAVMLDLILS